jgi:cytochrome P450 family 142 subfamily A polypeptide 1
MICTHDLERGRSSVTSTIDPTDPTPVSIDLVDGNFYGVDPYPAFAWMRRHAPAYFDEANGVWGITRYRDLKDISRNPDTFSSAGGIRPDFPALPMMIDMDAPEHVRRRRLVSEGFTPRRVREDEGWIREVCDQILDRVSERGECDFVSDIAARLPLIAIGDLLGVDESARDDLLRWSDDMLKGQGSSDPAAIERAATAFVEYCEYITGVIEQRRSTGQDDDLIGTLVHAEIEGDHLDDDSLIHESLLILIGGDETTRHVISGGMAELLRHPDQMQRLRDDPTRLPTAVEEMLRWVSPIKNMARTATREVELHGKLIRKGEKLLLLYPAANRDEEVFDRPEEFDTERSPNEHVAFGFGAHFCLGNQLARLELRVMFERLMERMPDIALADDGELQLRRANFVSGIERMPVVFTPTAAVAAP